MRTKNAQFFQCFDEIDAVIIMLLNPSRHCENIGVEDNVLGRKADADEQVIGAFANFDLALFRVGLSGLVESLSDRVAIGIVAGLVVGKAVGITGATYLIARFTRATLDRHLRWVDVLGLSVLAGVGFTVSLLIGDLAYGTGSARDDHVKVGVLCGSLLAALLAAVVLRLRNRTYRRLHEAEVRDADADGTPDVYQEPRASGG